MTSPTGLVARLRAAGCVFAEEEAALLLAAAGSPTELEELTDRRVRGEPLEHLLGWAQFGGRRVAVGPGVFVPRRRTEYLADLAVAATRAGDVVVELCCGAAAVAAAVLAAVPGAEVHAADVDPAAVEVARRNLAPAGHAHRGDLFDALPTSLRGRVAVLAANAPYVPTTELVLMPVEAREHEPRAALDGGPDGLDVQRRLIAAAPAWLAPGGRLLVETSAGQAPGTVAAFRAAGLDAEVHRDDDRAATVVAGRAVGGGAVGDGAVSGPVPWPR